MDNIDVLLSDEFVEFSTKIADVHSRKKSKQEELKTIYDKFKLEIKALDDEASELVGEFEAWKSTKGKK